MILHAMKSRDKTNRVLPLQQPDQSSKDQALHELQKVVRQYVEMEKPIGLNALFLPICLDDVEKGKESLFLLGESQIVMASLMMFLIVPNFKNQSDALAVGANVLQFIAFFALLFVILIGINVLVIAATLIPDLNGRIMISRVLVLLETMCALLALGVQSMLAFFCIQTVMQMKSTVGLIICFAVLALFFMVMMYNTFRFYIMAMPLTVWHWPMWMKVNAGHLYFFHKKSIETRARAEASRLKDWLAEHAPELYHMRPGRATGVTPSAEATPLSKGVDC